MAEPPLSVARVEPERVADSGGGEDAPLSTHELGICTMAKLMEERSNKQTKKKKLEKKVEALI